MEYVVVFTTDSSDDEIHEHRPIARVGRLSYRFAFASASTSAAASADAS